ncbi:uncharacterized protein LOC131430686 [Malaya genurostris]|uniref:uncharacterized protein LOC131430686 n=1 Tax=Malaya genurostris TaxID=325434 RepID=UPI0026F3E9DF|nr:uncharacterized protein LOC131430686 [Malaya genurostris]
MRNSSRLKRTNERTNVNYSRFSFLKAKRCLSVVLVFNKWTKFFANMIQPPLIRNLKELLEPVLEPGTNVLGYQASFLTAPGDNYGSTMLAVMVDISNAANETKKLPLVAKMIPASEEFWEVFQIDTTFVKEAAVYSHIVPTMVDLQREVGFPEAEIVDVFCRCYNTRVSLDPNCKKVDADGVILLENLKFAGYITENRRKGFTREQAEFILMKLSLFHAIPIALRYQKPDIYESNLKKFLIKFNSAAGLGAQTVERMVNVTRTDLVKAGVEVQLVERVTALVNVCRHRQAKLTPDELTEYFSILHNDLWVNNMMIKYDDSKRPVGLKFVDFQLTQRNSLVRDVLFFLLTSTNDPDLKNSMDDYLEFYFKHLQSNLAKLKIPNLSQYTYQSFQAEVNRIAPREIFHILMMLRVVLAKKESIPEQSEQDVELFSSDNLVEEDYYNQLFLVVKIFDQKKWV